MRSSGEIVRLLAVLVGGVLLASSTAKCEPVEELLGHSFSMTVTPRNDQTNKKYVATVKIGKSINADRGEELAVDYVLTISPPFPEESGFPSRHVGKGCIVLGTSTLGSPGKTSAIFKNLTGHPKMDSRTHDSPKWCQLRIHIGGKPLNEFSADGFMQITGHGGFSAEGEDWEK